MTSKDKITVDDKDFDAFLQREGELALLLQKLPQPAPSAELDAAILAAAKAELEKASAPQSRRAIAANDPQVPGNKGTTPGFIRRWRVTLGLAASLLVTVQLVRLEMTDEQTVPNAPAMLLKKAPADDNAPPAEKPPPESVPKMAVVTEEKRKFAEADRARTQESQRQASDRNVAVASDAMAPPAKVAVPEIARQPALKSYAPAPVAIQPPPEQYAKTGDYAARNAEPRPIAPIVAASPVAAPPPVFARAPAQAIAASPAPSVALQRADGAGSASRGVIVEERRPMAALAPIPDARSVDDVASGVAASGETTTNPAEAWLAKIEMLLKAGSNREALLEWRKFRKAYPDYVAPDTLNQKMKALDK